MSKTIKLFVNNNRWIIVILVLLLLVGGLVTNCQHNKINNLKNKYQVEVNLRKALNDTVNIYQNKEGEWVSEKLTIQLKIKDLEKISGELNDDQKRLLAKIKVINKEKSIIAAALIKANFVVDSFKHSGLVVVDTLNKSVEFTELSNKFIRYNFQAFGVLPYPINSKPTLLINNLTLPNEQFIDFHWSNEKKEGNPIAFSVINTNKYIKIYDINSYAIPELNKNIINPVGWEKVGVWLKRNGRIVGYVVGGIAIGAGSTYILMK